MNKRNNWFVWVVLGLAILVTTASISCRNTTPIDSRPRSQQDMHEVMFLHNKERAQRNLEQLKCSHELDQYAQEHAEWMARTNRLRHSNIDVNFGYRGENIAYGQVSPEAVMKAWMSSKGHRNNILNSNFTHAGFGCAYDRDGRPYWCSVFGG